MSRETVPAANSVRMAGKISRAGKLAYTPAGVPVLDFTLAAPQRYFGKSSMGHFEIMVIGETAEELKGLIRIGRRLTVSGYLWTRSFRDRKGNRVIETKILAEQIAEAIGGNDEEKRR